MSTGEVRPRSIHQQVTQEASGSAVQPSGFNLLEEGNGSHDRLTHDPLTDMPEIYPQRLPENYPMIPTTFETSTTSLAAIAGDTAMEGHAAYGIGPLADLEAVEHDLIDDNPLFRGGTNIDVGSFRGSQQNEASSVVGTEQHEIQAFAKLEFDDGEYYMNTYAVEIGRDIHATRQAADLQPRAETQSKSGKRSISAGGSVTSSKAKNRDGKNKTNSVAGENWMVPALEHYDNGSIRKPKSRRPKSWSSSSQQLSRKSSMLLSNGKTDYNALAMASLAGHDLEPCGFGPTDPMPAPELVPLVPIHPPGLLEGATSSGKSISRKHIRIAYNFEENVFEVKILGRNGGFVDEEWYAQGDVQTLMNGSIIQIGGVGIRFVLPDVAPGETGADTGLGSDPLYGGPGSFDMAGSIEDESDAEIDEDDEHYRTSKIKKEVGEEEEEEEEEEAEAEAEAEEPEPVKMRGKGKKKSEPEPSPVTKRKGPGRPPKNGVSSKREQALLAKQARENARVVADQESSAQRDYDKVTASKPTKGGKKEEPSLQPNGKRKYTKRKRAGGTDDQRDIRQSTEHTDSAPPEQSIAAKLPPKPAKDKKPPKPPRSPSPVWDEATLTPEQLAKPPQNYIVLIHEALSNSETGAMALPQIYRSMQRRYPYFKLRATTVGWQSSVRHNLSQNAAFRKIERDGKGWMWGLVPGVSIEKEKKRKPTPPPVSQQPYYPPARPPVQYPYPYPSIPPPNGGLPPNPYGLPAGMPPAQMPHGLPPRGPHGFSIPLVNAQSESSYQSPYRSTPPAQPSAHLTQSQHKPNTNGANGRYPTPPSQPPVQISENSHQSSGPVPSPLSAPNHSKIEAWTGSLGDSFSETENQDVVQAVARYRKDFIDSMPDKVRAESLVTSAINRTLGISSSRATVDDAEDPQEKTIMSDIATMLSDISQKRMNTHPRRTSDAASLPSEASPVFTKDGPASSRPAVSETAGVATNGGAHPRNGTFDKEDAEEKGNGKRTVENGDSDGFTEHAEPEAKRIATET